MDASLDLEISTERPATASTFPTVRSPIMTCSQTGTAIRPPSRFS